MRFADYWDICTYKFYKGSLLYVYENNDIYY